MIMQAIDFLRDEYEIVFCYFKKPGMEKSDEIKLNVKKVIQLQYPPLYTMVANNIVRQRNSIQENMFYSPATHRKIEELVNQEKPAVVIADMIRCSQFVENLKIKKICDMDDLLSFRYTRMLTAGVRHNNPLGTFSSIAPSFLVNLSWLLLKKTILKQEIRRIKRREVEILEKFDLVTLVSSHEVELLRRMTGSSKLEAVPPAIAKQPDLIRGQHVGNQCRLLFIGNLKYEQNMASVKHIVRNVLPVLERENLNYIFQIVGDYGDNAYKEIQSNSKIEMLGFVDSLPSIISTDTLFLCPILFGSGIKTKVLDAMSFGIPVITTHLGVEGIEGANHKDYFVEDDPVKMGQSVIKLWQDRELAWTIGQNGKRLVEDNYSYHKIKKRYKLLIAKTCSKNSDDS